MSVNWFGTKEDVTQAVHDLLSSPPAASVDEIVKRIQDSGYPRYQSISLRCHTAPDSQSMTGSVKVLHCGEAINVNF